MVNYKTNDDTNISCNVKKACRCPQIKRTAGPPPPPPNKKKKKIWNATFNVAYMIKPRQSTIDQNEMYVNAIQGTFFQVFLCLLPNEEVFIPERGWVFCQQFSFEFNNLDV